MELDFFLICYTPHTAAWIPLKLCLNFSSGLLSISIDSNLWNIVTSPSDVLIIDKCSTDFLSHLRNTFSFFWRWRILYSNMHTLNIKFYVLTICLSCNWNFCLDKIYNIYNFFLVAVLALTMQGCSLSVVGLIWIALQSVPSFSWYPWWADCVQSSVSELGLCL